MKQQNRQQTNTVDRHSEITSNNLSDFVQLKFSKGNHTSYMKLYP